MVVWRGSEYMSCGDTLNHIHHYNSLDQAVEPLYSLLQVHLAESYLIGHHFEVFESQLVVSVWQNSSLVLTRLVSSVAC